MSGRLKPYICEAHFPYVMLNKTRYKFKAHVSFKHMMVFICDFIIIFFFSLRLGLLYIWFYISFMTSHVKVCIYTFSGIVSISAFSHVPILYMKVLLAKLQILGYTGNHMLHSLKTHSELLFLYF